ncbi:MAG TPA: hydroxysqualene dehydroxylase HpnE [Rhizomicrobium sp.]
MKQGKVFVIGGGLAGLSAALKLADAGAAVELSEAAPQAGGRCRSYFDPALEQVIDNGNHLVLSGNHATYEYLRMIGTENSLKGPESASASFMDMNTGARWTLQPNDGLLAWWVLVKNRRVPDTQPADYLESAKLIFARPDQTIPQVVSCKGALWEKLVHPFLHAALNTEPKNASAQLAGTVIRETFAKGGRAYRLRIATPNLSAAFIDPAIAHLRGKNVDITFGRRLQRIVRNGAVLALEFPDCTVPVSKNDCVILAVPPWTAEELLPDISAPDEFRAIVNAHFRITPNPGAAPMTGVIGGTAEWVFAFHDRVSVTVSAADALVDMEREKLAHLLWADVARVLELPSALPPWQIVKEKRATFAATPEQAAKRPQTATQWPNLFVAGDWTDTGLPATIEGAVRSGFKAARLALARNSYN